MNQTPLFAISPLDGRYHQKLQALNAITSEFGLMRYRTIVEIQWLIHLIQQGNIISISPDTDTVPLQQLMDRFDESAARRIKDIEKITNHDVKSIEYFLQEKIQPHATLKPLTPFIHFGCTSEDINNLAYGLILKASREVLNGALDKIINTMTQFATTYANQAMLSRTHGQPASPTTLGKELKNFVARLTTQQSSMLQCPIPGKFNGAVGNYNAHLAAYPDHDWPAICQTFVESLGLEFNPHTTQIEPHDQLAALMHHLMRINTILIDFSRDIWQYISLGYFVQQKKENEVGSSTMPHKINPIAFENAEGNLGIANALAQHLANKLPISRLQRDLSDSTVQRNIGVVMGHSLLAYQSLFAGLNKLQVNSSQIEKNLNNHWELLAEPIQTVLRANGANDAYEQLKSLTRGQTIDQNTIQTFIDTLDIPQQAKDRLQALRPENYIGLANELATEN